ncbi:MAG: hypothetical protein KC933_29245 [Myxococcales bacterium]|nr:hypothetical protein [Myxococcales bacterium]
MPRRRPPPPLILAPLLFAACGGGEAEPWQAPLTEVTAAPTEGTWTSEAALAVAADPDAVGVDADHHVVVVAGGVTYALEQGALVPRPLYAEAGEPEVLGAARAVAPKAATGAWLATDAGLFSVDRHFVTRSPMSEVASDVGAVADVAAGPLAGLWLVSQGILHHATDALDALSVPGLGQVSHFAVSADGAFLVAAQGATVRVLEPGDGGLVARDPSLALGTVHGLAGAPGAVWLATSTGLYETDGAGFTRYTFGQASAPEVTQVAVDPATGGVWAAAGGSLYYVQGNLLKRHGGAAGERGLVVDQLGDLYSMASGALIYRGTGATDGTAVTFGDVVPWIEARCSACHSNQTSDFRDYDVFITRAEDALARVRSGDMPRCAGSVRCPTEEALAPADYAVLEQWIRDGMPQ